MALCKKVKVLITTEDDNIVEQEFEGRFDVRFTWTYDLGQLGPFSLRRAARANIELTANGDVKDPVL